MSESKHTPGPWKLCFHLESEEQDKSCPCGYRGGIWGADEERLVCEMGSTSIPGEEGLSLPRYDRATELANARLIAAAPELLEALKAMVHEGRGASIALAGFGFTTKDLNAAAACALTAIAKAEGRP